MKNKKYLYTYRIADIVFSIFSKNEIRTTENFFPFIYQGEKKDFIIQLEEKESMPFEMNNVLFENYIFKAGKDKEGYYRIFCDHKENNRPYAQSRIYDNGMEEICYLKEFQNSFSESQNTFSHIGFEELLIRKKCNCFTCIVNRVRVWRNLIYWTVWNRKIYTGRHVGKI